ncbi:MAG: hypothetical protein LBS42_00785 [Tannerella sp.]|nr:hypothetical protein [Tannerella sp.]
MSVSKNRKERVLISFDYALKRLLRNKANYDVLEGFLSELLMQDIRVRNIVESESNRTTASEEQNRVDIPRDCILATNFNPPNPGARVFHKTCSATGSREEIRTGDCRKRCHHRPRTCRRGNPSCRTGGFEKQYFVKQ